MRFYIAASVATACVTLAACNSATGSVAPISSADAITVIAVAPANATIGVDPGKPVVVTFGRAMMSGMESSVLLHEGPATGPVVAGTAVWSVDRTTLTLTPAAPLKARTLYTVHLSPGLKGASGQSIDLRSCTQLGGVYATGAMMGVAPGAGMMNGSWGPGMMGDGWRAADGSFGVIFTFTIA